MRTFWSLSRHQGSAVAARRLSPNADLRKRGYAVAGLLPFDLEMAFALASAARLERRDLLSGDTTN